MKFSDFLSNMKNGYEKLISFNKNWKAYFLYLQEHCSGTFDEQSEYFDRLAEYLNVSDHTAQDIWYSNQRSWFKPEMVDVMIDMDRNPDKYSFHPIYTSGAFIWDSVNKKFIPEV